VQIVIGLAIAGVAMVPITLWSRYSTTYVTSRNATVKGSITHVGAQISGVLVGVEVEAGQRVEAGQVLARFEDHQLQAKLLRATSRLREARAHSASARTRIDAAETQKLEAKARHDQRVPLAKTGAISRDEMRTAETRLWTSEAMARTAVAEYNASGAEVSTAEAELELARADLAASVIRAPAEGRVVRRISEPGTSVIIGQPIVDLLVGKEVWVEAWIDQASLSRVAVGNDVEVTVSSFPGRPFQGKVASIGVSTDFELPEAAVPQSRKERMRTSPVVPVRVQLDEHEGLMPGLSAVVAIQRTDAKSAAAKRTAAR
jgi:multidrug resistance efflux pump